MNCGHELAMCSDGKQEVFKHRFCDGIVDCEDESDEIGCSCKYNKLKEEKTLGDSINFILLLFQ